MSKDNLLDAVLLKPEGEPKRSVIWLHGLGANGHDFVDAVPMLGLPNDFGARFVFPHAPARPVTLNYGMRMPAWYDIQSLQARDQEDESGIRDSQQLIKAWLDHETKLVGAQNVFVLGFSQGGAMALHSSLRYEQRLAGCAVLSGYLPLGEILDEEAAKANRDLPIFVAHGNADPTVDFNYAASSVEALTRLGWHPEFIEYPMEHQVCASEMTDLGRWLKTNAR